MGLDMCAQFYTAMQNVIFNLFVPFKRQDNIPSSFTLIYHGHTIIFHNNFVNKQTGCWQILQFTGKIGSGPHWDRMRTRKSDSAVGVGREPMA